jgi:hypothetical protein
MQQILLGSLALSLVHAAIPNHWVPLVVIARAEGWSRARALQVTAIAGAAHTASTIGIGVLVGAVGLTLASQWEVLMGFAAPAILVGFGIMYLLLGLRERAHRHPHAHVSGETLRRRSTGGIVASLALAMFFSPCLEIEAYYLTAALHGWLAIGAVSTVYLVVTVAGMMALVAAGLAGVGRLRFHALEHHERVITGGLLVLLGLAAWFLR